MRTKDSPLDSHHRSGAATPGAEVAEVALPKPVVARGPAPEAAQKPPTAPAAAAPRLVVGVGASAGGLDACQRLLRGTPTDAGLAFVIVLHLAPDEKSHLASILQRATAMPVSQVTGEERIRANHVYVIAPGTSLGMRDGVLIAGAPEQPHYRARPIDAFFSALAADRAPGAAAIVLSGTGKDGSAGLRAIHDAGGRCLVQDPDTAEYDGMPRAAIDTGIVEPALPPEEMGEALARFAAEPAGWPAAAEPREVAASATAPEGTPGAAASPAEPETSGSIDPEDAPEIAGEHATDPAPKTGDPAPGRSSDRADLLPREGVGAILDLLAKRYRVDFHDYKRGTLQRRTERRIGLHGLDGWQAYRAYLQTHPEEVEALYGDLLIGVTSFFRDPEEWQAFASEVVPALVQRRNEPTAVRVWSAGCATGQEAYGLAIVLLEHLETLGSRVEVRVFASDASPDALAIARRGRYPAEIAEHVSARRLERFFRPTADGFEVTRDLRSAVTFASHDLLSDPPFPHLDLVACRNVLIYLEPAAQEHLLERFHFGLRAGGTLWLGAAETIGRRTDLFAQRPGGHRFYRATRERHGYPLTARRARVVVAPATKRVPAEEPVPEVPRLVEKLVLERYTTPCVVVGQGLEILYFFGPTDPFLKRPDGEVRLDLLAWVRPELYAKLRAGLTEATETRRRVTLTGLRLEEQPDPTRVEITIEPIAPGLRQGGMLLVAFRDLPGASGAALDPAEGDEDEASVAIQARQELHDTREQLRTAVDQLRTVTEEHAASYEELLSLNEELQSSNAELEASKEELQSLNEELTTTNRQLEERNEELRILTSDLDNLLVSAAVPTVFLDRELKVRRFTPAASEVVHIAEGDLGQPLAELNLRVRDEGLLADAQQVLEEWTEIAAEVPGEDDRWFVRRVLPYRESDGKVSGLCLTFHDITAQKEATATSEYARVYAESIIRTSRAPLLVLDRDHRVVSANAAFYSAFEIDQERTVGRRIYELGNGQWAIPRVRALLEEATSGRKQEIRDYEIEHVFEGIGWRSMRLNADVMPRSGRPDLILVSIEDVTDLRKAQITAQRRADELAQDHRRKDEFLAMLGHELRNPLAALVNGVDLLARAHDDKVDPVRGMMERQTRRMTAMLDQLLDVARVISGKLELTREAVDVAEAARAAIEGVRPLFEAAGHQLTVTLPPDGTVLVLGDPARLAQVVENLLANAAKYTADGGRISLALEATHDTVELTVRDSGIGIDPALLSHVFDLFTQAPSSLHRAKGGLGLGLSLVHNLVEMHGGSVEALSAGEGKGTEFVVTLPRLRAKAHQKRGALPEVAPPPPHRILVVDDEVDTAEALVQLLEMEGHTARAAPDGESALALVRSFDPELVLLDLGLPRMDGYEVAHRLRELLGQRPRIVALTGYRDEPARLKEAGFDGHLLKPTSLEKLFALMSTLERSGEAGPPPG